jgi:single-stranded DNA-binding protein
VIFAQAHGTLEYDAQFQPPKLDFGARLSFIVRVLGRGPDSGMVTFVRCNIVGRHAEVMSPHLRRGKHVLIGGCVQLKQRPDGQSFLSMRVQTLELLDPRAVAADFDDGGSDAV